ncbi:MAG: hypothetical protein A2V77_23725 [Anaeromyxobacter sp. RBG_16_69_14]|nr:MAG: hypothetical protein A2V77_23725 [Anaeromyxobacter sp. RBG_16_69_14]
MLRAEAATPLQFLAPRVRGTSAWVFLLSHGGGLVAGDDVAVEVEVGPGATALLATQAETKVYRAHDGRGAVQRLDARVRRSGALAILPEPVSPFAGAHYEQRQRFDLEEGASLLAVDAVVAGRSARGERWAFDRYLSSNEVRVDGRLVMGDALVLEPREPREACEPHRFRERLRGHEPRAPGAGSGLATRLGRFDAFALAFALGPAFSDGARALLARLAAQPVERDAHLLAAASPLEGGALLRCAATSPEALADFLRQALAFAAAPLGDDPFAGRW